MRILAAAVVFALAASFIVSFLLGVFDEMALSAGECGPYCLVYLDHTGPYREVNSVLPDIGRYLRNRGVPVPARAFASFLDNPRKVKPGNLRSMAGYITDSLLPDVKPPVKTAVIPATRAVKGVFPVRSFLSKNIGPLKFYPRLLRYCENEKLVMNGPVMEIYDSAGKRIEYIAPVK
jgi:AraC family transcriptional regulator